MRRKRMVVCFVVIAVMLFSLWRAGLRLLQHERNQTALILALNENSQQQIADLQAQINDLRERAFAQKSYAEYPDETFNYLAIGNSITLSNKSDNWWNECGMAASSTENDYVHLVEEHLKRIHGDVYTKVLRYYLWEIQAHDRAETFEFLDPYLAENLDLVTIQLGENVTDTTMFKSDLEELVRHIQSLAPHAGVVIIDDFWDGSVKPKLKEEVASSTGVDFISLKEIRFDEAYTCGIGAVVYDDNGSPHEVTHAGVAVHPNDNAMKYIADAIIGTQ